MTAGSSDELVLLEVDGEVAILRFNRPDRMNAWIPAMGTRYAALLRRLAGDPAVRAVVVTGSGGAFCAGGDLDHLGDLGAARSKSGPHPPDRRPIGPRPLMPPDIGKPVIAAINGACAGIGFVQALLCDLRFAATGAKLTTAFSRRGLVQDEGMAWLLPRVVGTAAALDLMLSGRTLLAEEARRNGLVNGVFPPDRLLANAVEYARELAYRCSPTSMALLKSAVYAGWSTDFSSARDAARSQQHQAMRRSDFVEGIASFKERRPPRFSDLPNELWELATG